MWLQPDVGRAMVVCRSDGGQRNHTSGLWGWLLALCPSRECPQGLLEQRPETLAACPHIELSELQGQVGAEMAFTALTF